jgi:hypothetical protein
MEANGVEFKKGEQAHHIMPQAATDDGTGGLLMNQARALMDRAGIDIHGLDNGMVLSAQDNIALNNQIYNREIAQRIIKAGPNKEAILKELDKMRQELMTNPSKYFRK